MECSRFWIHTINYYLFGPYYIMEDIIRSTRNSPQINVEELLGEVAVVTGGHRGIGAMISSRLLAAGVHLILGCRKKEDGMKFVEKLREHGVDKGNVTILHLDLASLKSVRDFADAVLKESKKINFLINNAGVWIKGKYVETEDNLECHWQVNYLSHFLLTHLLFPALEKSGKGKIVNVSSVAHQIATSIDLENINNRKIRDNITFYSRSKLAQIMSSLHLDRTLKAAGSNVKVMSVHPGLVSTEIILGSILQYLFCVLPFIFKTPKAGAKSVVYAALKGQSGQYYVNCRRQKPSSTARDTQHQQILFDYSMHVLNIESFGIPS